MLTKFYCQECGGEIFLTYERSSSTFGISDDGTLVRVDQLTDEEGLHFHCENDLEHTINPPRGTRLYKLFEKWCDQMEEHFYLKFKQFGDI